MFKDLVLMLGFLKVKKPNIRTRSLNMRIIAAYLLAVLGGNSSPDASAITKILDAGGIKYEKDKVEKLVGELKTKPIDEVIAQGSTKLASLPAAGVGGGPSAPAPEEKTEAKPQGGKKGGEEKKEEKKKKEEPKEEEEDGDMGFGLFD